MHRFLFFAAFVHSSRKDKEMKIKYTFANGDVSEVEVSEEVGTVIVDSRRKEESQARKERYHCYSYDAIEYEGEEFADPDSIDAILEREYLSIRVAKAMSHLTETQVRRITLLSEGHSIREIARMEGVDHMVVSESIIAARKKFLKFF